MTIISYKSSRGDDLILKYIDNLPTDEQESGYQVLICMEEDNFEVLTWKYWRGKVREVYFGAHKRIYFIMIQKSTIYLLHSCKKQKNRTEKKDTGIILKRAKELENMLGIKLL